MILIAADVCRGEEMETEENKEKIETMKKLIFMRKKEAACKSLYFHFPREYKAERLVEYIKLDENGDQLEILLNCSTRRWKSGTAVRYCLCGNSKTENWV